MTSSTLNLDNVRGVEVTGAKGVKLGKVDNIYVDNDTNQPEWIAVKSGLFGTHVSLVPIRKAQFDGAVLSVPFDKEQLKSAPHHHPNTDLLLAVAEDEDVGVIGVDDEALMRTPRSPVEGGALVFSVTGSSPR